MKSLQYVLFFPAIHTCSHLLYTVHIGLFDGKVAAGIWEFVCMMPIQNRIFLPPMQMWDIFLRSDICYGPNDHTLWPQVFLFEYHHLGTIPRQPDNPKDPLAIMWWNLTWKKIFPLENGVLDGMGQMSTLKYWTFQEMLKDLKERVEKYGKLKSNSLLSLLVRLIDDALICLGSSKSPFGLMWFKVTEFQCLYLKIYALLDYLEIYKP